MAKDLRLAIYRELPCFPEEACRLLDREAPPVAANETVVSEGSAELLSDTRVVPSDHQMGTAMEITEQPEVPSAKRPPGAGGFPFADEEKS